MLPSLCRVMAAILPVSRYRESRDGGPEPNREVYLPLAGSIGTRMVARLFLNGRCAGGCGPRCRRNAAERPAGGARAGRWTQEGAASGRRLHGR